ncbi:MAG TPA: NADH-quinone oxidoreductase subunit N [Lacipirellulaceae bacterium]|nr:NADH-quinone oxidoreductase subunit N [Lacipirellulaceae bacterium]
MNLPALTDSLIRDTLDVSLPHFRPELALCVTIVSLLLARVIPLLDRIPPFAIALLGALAALAAAVPDGGMNAAAWGAIERQELFTGMLVYDAMTVYMRLFLTAFAVLFVVLSRLTGIADRDDGQDYFVLVFGATLGMCVMASANHLLTLFLGVEMASVPSYVLAGIIKGRQRSSEAALKYAVYGAGTAGIMLYGASLLGGVLGSAHFPTLAGRLIEFDLPAKLDAGDWSITVLALGGLMLGVGLAFKLSAVPFHFWCPDVFEGSAAEVGAFLSVASKAAALALLVRVGVGLGYAPDEASRAAQQQAAPVVGAPGGQSASGGAVVRLAALQQAAPDAADEGGEGSAESATAAPEAPLSPVRRFFVTLVALVAIVTCTFGNLAAYGQKNIKRMLAYSTIAHAGFMMMPVAAAVSLCGHDVPAAKEAVAAMLFYATIYLFMNLGAFAIIAFLRNSMRSEEIKDYAGLIGRSPLAAVLLTLILVSLIGLPPLAGFWPKLRVLQSLYEAGGPLLMSVMVAAAMNTAISLVYYLRVAKTMCIDPQPDTSLPVDFGFMAAIYVLLVAAPVVAYGLLPNLVAPWAQQATAGLFG